MFELICFILCLIGFPFIIMYAAREKQWIFFGFVIFFLFLFAMGTFGKFYIQKEFEKTAIENGYAKQVITNPIKGTTEFKWVHEITNR